MDFEIYMIIILVAVIALLYFFSGQILGAAKTIKLEDANQQKYVDEANKGLEKAASGAKIVGDGAKELGSKVFEKSKEAAGKAWEFAQSEEAKTMAGQIKDGIMRGFDTTVDYTADLLSDVCSGGKPKKVHRHCMDCHRVIAEPEEEVVEEGVIKHEWLLENA